MRARATHHPVPFGLSERVQAFRKATVLVIGDAMLDTYMQGAATRLCREGPVPVVAKSVEEHQPGGAANSAANLRALGADVRYVGLIGADAAGRQLRAALRALDVDDGFLVTSTACETLEKMRIVANDQYVVRFDSGHVRAGKAEERRLLAALKAGLDGADVVVVADYCYGLLSAALVASMEKLRSRYPVPLVIDSKNLLRFARSRATLVTPNHHEAHALVNPSSRPESSPSVPDVERVGRRLLTLVDAEAVAVTMASDGVLLLDRKGARHFPTHRVARANDVGAGDSFTAAAALALACGASTDEAVQIGIEAGSIAVTKERTAVVRHGELIQRVARASESVSESLDGLARRLAESRARGDRVVFTNGVFDILHAGHVHFLRESKALGDILVVAVNTDRSAGAIKGRNRPINSAADRAALVAALDPVDHVVTFDEETPDAIIRLLKPDVHVKGGDYAGQELPEAEAVREVGGELVVLPLLGDHSTSGVIDRILRLAPA